MLILALLLRMYTDERRCARTCWKGLCLPCRGGQRQQGDADLMWQDWGWGWGAFSQLEEKEG